ncbi:MAG: FixH family protein [Deltaproteobacteria bacterium]|nr:FixH family protein [Deltaproteobacteria bacterium]
MRDLGRMVWSAAVIVSLGAGLGACADEVEAEGDGFPPEPLVTVTGAWVEVEARSGPEQPPVRGVFEVELAIADLQGAPLAGLEVAVRPWMPAMHHGTSVQARVTERAPGVYLVSDVGCPMAGAWVLETDVTAGDGSRSEHLQIPVQVR